MSTSAEGGHDPGGRGRPERSGLGSRRVVGTAFAVSVLVHLWVIVIYPSLFESLDPDSPLVMSPDSIVPDGLEIIELLDLEATFDPVEPDDPDELEQLTEPTEDAAAPEIEGLPGIEIVPLAPTGAELLRPGFADARLWRRMPDEFFELSVEQREELAVAQRLPAWLDSVGAEAEAERRATDWTYTDANGGRWGISPGKLHLGDVTIPLPVNFGEPIGKREENAQLVWRWEEIMRQAARADVELNWRERAEAIRARRDAERAVEVPDTTRSR